MVLAGSYCSSKVRLVVGRCEGISKREAKRVDRWDREKQIKLDNLNEGEEGRYNEYLIVLSSESTEWK